MNATDFKVGQETKFFYNDKLREGTVEKVKDSVVIIKLHHDYQNKSHKAFSYDKIVLCPLG